jgi:hypothetical protein
MTNEAPQNAGIRKLEDYEDTIELNIDKLLEEYRQLHSDRPLWHLVEDIQRQAMIYSNIIELLKSGKPAHEIRATIETLGLVPEGKLPNPNIPALLTKALDKLAQYRLALVEIVKRYGGPLLNELSFETGLTVSVGVEIGFPPAITIAVEHTATAKASLEFR